MTGTILALVLPVAFLFMFYRAVESEWPESYSVLATNSSLWSSRSLGHYLGFRIAPVLAVTTFAAVATNRAERNAFFVALGVPLVHWALTSGRRIVRDMRASSRPNNFLPSLFVACGLFLAYTFVGVLAWLLREQAGPLIPEVDEIVTGLWTAFSAGIVAVFLTDRRVSGSPDSYAVIGAAVRDIAPEHKAWCEKYSAASDTDARLLQTVLVVESLSRPRWFRKLEDISARIMKRSGTYGLMQVTSDHPVSDEESVEIAARDHFAGLQVPLDENDYLDWEELRRLFARYNPDDQYVEICEDESPRVW